jgi:hypothetical protein
LMFANVAARRRSAAARSWHPRMVFSGRRRDREVAVNPKGRRAEAAMPAETGVGFLEMGLDIRVAPSRGW